MDLSYMCKLSNFNRTCSEAEQLRDKINKENKKSIQWRVEQQASYHQLTEKFKQLESNYESLQQNMLHAQMEREKMSESFVHEKQRRGELMNKVSSTREMCEALTKYSTGLQETLGRCRSDLTALCDAYNNATDVVRNIKQQYKLNTDKMQSDVNTLQDKVKLLNESRSQLEQFCESNKHEAAVRTANIEHQCAEERHRGDELRALIQEERLRGHTHKITIQQKENELTALKEELQHLRDLKNKVLAEMEDALQKQINANDLMKQDIHNYEEAIEILRNENNKLQNLSAEANKNIQRYTVEIEQLNDTLNKHEETKETLLKELVYLKDKYQLLNNEKETEVSSKIEEIEELTTIMDNLKTDKEAKEAVTIKLMEELEINKKILEETEKNLVTCKDEILKLKEGNESNDKNFNEMKTKWEKIKDESIILYETIETQQTALVEGEAKFAELQEKYNEEVVKTTTIIKEKEEIVELNNKITQEFSTEKEELNKRLAELEKKLEELKFSPEIASMKSVPNMTAPQDDNAILTQPSANYVPIRNEMFFFTPEVQDVYNYNFSDSSQGSFHRTDLSNLFDKKIGSQTINYKKRKVPSSQKIDLPAPAIDAGKMPRTKIFKTKNVYQHKAI